MNSLCRFGEGRILIVVSLWLWSACLNVDEGAGRSPDVEEPSKDPGTPEPEDPEVTEENLYLSSLYMAERFEEAYSSTGMLIDLSDDGQYEFVQRRLINAGLTSQTAPGMYAALEGERSAAIARKKSGVTFKAGEGKQCGTFGFVSDVTAEGAVSQMHFSCFDEQEGTTFSFRDHYLLINGEIVDYQFSEGTPDQVEPMLVAMGAYPGTVSKGPEGVTCDSLQVGFTADGTKFIYFTCAPMIPPAGPTGGPVELSMDHPKNMNGSADENIFVCLNREWLDPELVHECDYLHSMDPANCAMNDICLYPPRSSPTDPFENAPIPLREAYQYGKLYIPLVGRAFPNLRHDPPDTPDTRPPSIARADAWLTLESPGDYTTGGGICTPNINIESCIEIAHVSVDSWRLTLNCVPRFGDATWESHCIDNRQKAALNIAVNVVVQRFGVTQSYNFWWNTERAQSDEPEDKPYLTFQWGCLAPDTEIRMADGTLQLIQDIRSDQMVQANNALDLLSVAGVMTGVESHPLMYVEDENGHRLRMTMGHPVPLVNGGVVAARDLKVGDLVWTEKGVAALTVVEHQAYEGEVFNLSLGSDAELAEIGESKTTMFANGILVGDARMQEALAKQRMHQPPRDFVNALPESLRVDYQNAQVRQAVRRTARTLKSLLHHNQLPDLMAVRSR